MPFLYSWRPNKFLYDDLVACWGKPCYVQTDNSAKFVGSFAWLFKGLGIFHYHITMGNSKANEQVEWTISMLKDRIWHGLMKEPASFWMNHLASALLLLCMTVSQTIGIMLFLLATGCQPLLPSMAIPGVPSLPDQPTPDEKEAYLAKVSYIIAWL